MSGPTRFDVLGTMRAVRRDKKLTSTQKALLVFAALRTNNGDGKVKLSLEGVAEDAGLSAKTAYRALAEGQDEALKYFSRVERSRRNVDLWFKMQPEGDTESYSEQPRGTQSPTRKGGTESLAKQRGTSCPPRGTESPTERDTQSHHLPLSTSSSTDDRSTVDQASRDPWAEAEANPLPMPPTAAPDSLADVDWSQMPSFDDEEDQGQPATETGYGELLGSLAERDRRRRERLAAKAKPAESPRQRGSWYAA